MLNEGRKDEHGRDGELLNTIALYLRKISNETDFINTLELLTDLGRELIDAERCTLWLLDKKEGKIISKVAHDVDALEIQEGEGLVGHVIETAKELVINNPYEDERFSKKVDTETGYKTKQLVTIPIKNMKGEILGAFQGVNSKAGHFCTKDIENLRMVAAFSAKTLENSRLEMCQR